MRAFAVSLLVLSACAPAPAGDRVHGIVVSTHLDGRDWAWDGVPPALRRIRALGANWIAIHPYAAIADDGSVRFARLDPAAPPEWLARPVREAHALGLKILISPHLAHWGSRFSWRGDIRFDREADWARFWDGYTRFIVELSAATVGADAFAVGSELDATLDHEPAWRELIRRVRERTAAPLTYGANWTDYERVPFWDALDAIGVQAYFPLADTPDPGEPAIRAGWSRWMERLRVFAAARRQPIVFTELGYNRSYAAPVRPWDDRTDDEGASRVQAACLRAALEAIEREPAVIGAFLWKWFPEPRPLGRNFQLATPEIESVIVSTWRPAASLTSPPSPDVPNPEAAPAPPSRSGPSDRGASR